MLDGRYGVNSCNMKRSKFFLIISAVFPPEPVVSAKSSFQIAEAMAVNRRVIVLTPRPTRPYGYKFESTSTQCNHFEQIIVDSYTNPGSQVIGRAIESLSFGKHCVKYIEGNHHSIEAIYLITWPLFGHKIIVKCARKYNIPVASHITDLYPESYTEKMPWLLGRYVRKLLQPIDDYVHQNSTIIITVSPKLAEYIIKTRHVEPSKVKVVRNWQDDESYVRYDTTCEETPNGSTIFLFLGNIALSCGLESLIPIFGKFSKNRNCKFIIAGSGARRVACEKLTQNLQLSNVTFMDAPNDKIMEIQSQADILVLSLKKGVAMTATPSKLVAYCYTRRPVLAVVDKDSDTAECILSNKFGFVASPDVEKEVLAAFEESYNTSVEERKKMGENAFEFAQSNLSKGSNLVTMVGILSNLTDNNRNQNRV